MDYRKEFTKKTGENPNVPGNSYHDFKQTYVEYIELTLKDLEELIMAQDEYIQYLENPLDLGHGQKLINKIKKLKTKIT